MLLRSSRSVQRNQDDLVSIVVVVCVLHFSSFSLGFCEFARTAHCERTAVSLIDQKTLELTKKLKTQRLQCTGRKRHQGNRSE